MLLLVFVFAGSVVLLLWAAWAVARAIRAHGGKASGAAEANADPAQPDESGQP